MTAEANRQQIQEEAAPQELGAESHFGVSLWHPVTSGWLHNTSRGEYDLQRWLGFRMYFGLVGTGMPHNMGSDDSVLVLDAYRLFPCT